MPVYSIGAPNGKTYEVEVPNGVTREQATKFLLKLDPNTLSELSSKREPDLSKLSDADLKVLAEGNVKGISEPTQLVAPASMSSTAVPSTARKPDADSALGFAAIQTVTGMAIAVTVFWLLTKRLWKKPRATPHELGYWLACWVGCLQLGLSVGKFTGGALYGTVSNNDIYLLAMNGVVVAFIFGLCAYVVGWLFRRFIRPTSAPVPIDSHTSLKAASSDVRPNQSRVTNDHFAQALSEIDSEKTDKGLWARCFADANGDEPKAKAAYIKKRANDLSNNA